MCRGGIDTVQHRRCKDTEGERIAKANYRARQKLQATYSSVLNPKRTEAPTHEVLVDEKTLKEQRINELFEIIDTPQGDLPLSEYELRLSAAYISLGEELSEKLEPAEEKLSNLIATEEKLKKELEQKIHDAQARLRVATDNVEEITQDVYKITGITRATHPVMSDRFAALQEQFPEEWQRIAEAEEASEKAQREFREAIQERNHHSILGTIRGNSQEMEQVIAERREAYKEALEDLGVEFASESTISVHEKSAKKAVDALNSVLPYFPKEWVEASNNSNEKMVVKNTSGRAHYSRSAPQTVASPKISSQAKPIDWRPDPNDPEYKDAVRIEPGVNHYTEPISGRTYRLRHPFNPNETLWMVPEYKQYSRRLSDGTVSYTPSRKAGWEEYEVEEFDYNTNEVRKTTRYRKMLTRNLLSSNAVLSELTVSGDSENERRSVAAHEFSHRIEHVVPEIARAEKAFLAYRSKQHTDKPERISRIQGSEKGYKDGFATHYIGRVYDGKAFEIMSVGMEMLMFGKHGGFQGKGDYGKDIEHRNFMLGVLASSARRNKKADI